MIVCHNDIDLINPQVYPITLRPENLSNPDYVRTEPAYQEVENARSDQLPSAPRNLTAQVDMLSNYITLTWDSPTVYGSSPIIGYRVTRAHPQLASQDVLVANTNTPATFYLDLSSDTSDAYTYQVAAISILGVSPYSNYAFWPSQQVADNINYIATDDGMVITTDDGIPFIWDRF